MTAWLITGGAGFIGSNFLRLACQRDVDTIVVLDALTYAGDINNIVDIIDGSRIRFTKGNICDTDLVYELFSNFKFDCVIHFAAESHVDRSILGPQPFIETNIQGTYVLIDAARRFWEGNIGGRRFIHVSTDEVFGDLAPAAPPAVEGTPYQPSSPYAASKAAADHLVRAWHRTFGLPAIITNCGNNYGPSQFPEKFIPLLILNALEANELPVYGDGMQIRDWLHVSDHCRALLAVIDKGEVGQTYLISSGEQRCNIDVVRMICQAVDVELGRPVGMSVELIRHVKDRQGHDRRYALDASWIRESLGWRPQENFDTALPALVRWYIAHRGWADSIRSGAYQKYYQSQYADR